MRSRGPRERVVELVDAHAFVVRGERPAAHPEVVVDGDARQPVERARVRHATEAVLREQALAHRRFLSRLVLREAEADLVQLGARQHVRHATGDRPGGGRDEQGFVLEGRAPEAVGVEEPGAVDVAVLPAVAQEHAAHLPERLVEPHVHLVGGVSRLGVRRVVVHRARQVRLRDERQQLQGRGIHAAQRNRVVRERRADPADRGQRIVDGLAAEVAGPHLGRRHGADERVRRGVARPLVAAEEERAVADDRPAERAAELVVAKRRLREARLLREILLLVEGVIPEELECRPLELVRARLDRERDDPARGVPVLRAEVRALDTELLDGIDRRAQRLRRAGVEAHDVVVVVDAVDPVVGLEGPGAVEADAVGRSRVLVGRRPGRQGHQLGVVATVERQGRHARVVDDLPDRGGLALDDRRRPHDVDDVRDRAHLHREVHAGRLAELQDDAGLLHGREALELDLDGVLPRPEARQGVVAVCPRHGRGEEPVLLVGGRDGHPGDDPFARVDDAAGELGRLRQGG